MTERKMCTDCDGTGLHIAGFCHYCRGEGYRQVLRSSGELDMTPSLKFQTFLEHNDGQVDALKLFRVMSQHTTKQQLSDIMNDFFRLSP